MDLHVPVDPVALAGKAREVIARVRPGSAEGRRSLPIRRPAGEIRRLWDDPQARAAVLAGLPVASASLTVSPEPDRDWGTTATLDLRLDAPIPGTATQALAGKAVRRLKALAETGEVPTTDRNPSARPDAGEPAT
jgi:predicted RNA-binding Zn ribbon-like protein